MLHVSYVKFCTKPWEELVVYPNGEYSICCGGPPVGKIRQAGEIKDLWNNPTILQYRENLNNGFEFGICRDCIYHGTLRNTTETGQKRPPRDIYKSKIPIISFGLTDQCNLSCFMCGVSKKYKGLNRKLYADRLPLEYCREFAIHHFPNADGVNSNCFGEIFLYPKLKAFLRLLKEHRPKSFITTTTSGSLNVPPRLWHEVMAAHNELIFSVDSHDRAIHNIIRGFDYDIFERNIRIVQHLRDTEFPAFKYGCSVVLMKLTIATLYDTLRIAHEEYGCQVFNLQHVSGLPAQSLAKEKQWRLLYNVMLAKCQDYMRRYNIGSNGEIGFYRDAAGNVES